MDSRTGTALVDCSTGNHVEFTNEAIRYSPRYRYFAFALKLLDCSLGVRAYDAGWLQLPITEVSQRPLYGGNPARGNDQVTNRIAVYRYRRSRRVGIRCLPRPLRSRRFGGHQRSLLVRF